MKALFLLVAIFVTLCLGVAISMPFFLEAQDKSVIQENADCYPQDPAKLDTVPNPFNQDLWNSLENKAAMLDVQEGQQR